MCATTMTAMTALCFTGMFFGGLGAGAVSDAIGRRLTLIAALSINTAAAFLSAFAPTTAWLITFRVLAGIGERCAQLHTHSRGVA